MCKAFLTLQYKLKQEDIQIQTQSLSSNQIESPSAKKAGTWETACSFIFIFGLSLASFTPPVVLTLRPGSPAAGKGTMCRKLASDPEFAHAKLYHLSLGDHLRGLRANGSLDSSVAQELAKQTLISGAVLVKIIEQKVAAEFEVNDARVFLLDGFPRNEEQMKQFSERVGLLQYPYFTAFELMLTLS